jgi:hypothetical protein
MKHLISLTSLIALAVLLPPMTGWAKSNLESELREFDRDPAKYMDRVPEKRGRAVTPKFSREVIRSKRFIEAKNRFRPLRGRAAIQGNDRAENLVDNGRRLVRSLVEMEQQKLKEGAVLKNPWSDHYWSLYEGQLANRYADTSFPAAEDWKKNAEYLNRTPKVDVDDLSPSEKYDLLVGDGNKSLTKAALAEGEQFYRSSGSVESWMGICHGWAPAAYMFDRPQESVTVLAADGKTKIKFRPSDIKALASLLWAKHSPDVNYMGGRCNTKDPKKDSVGRVADQDCFDTNPGSWHLAVVNQIGVSKRPFVMDATFDYEVWNHPVISYSYEYFNPQTREAESNLDKVMIAKNDYTKDKFKKYRGSEATHMVGVRMTVNYMSETRPSTSDEDNADADDQKEVSYMYDLELDSSGNIIGGEWYTNLHPDFLWTPSPKARSLSSGDDYLIRQGADRVRWDGQSALPKDWQEVAARTSANGSPLALIVENLVRLAQ